jgi:aminoglycoside phosphotransferase (APT) family kinase protein
MSAEEATQPPNYSADGLPTRGQTLDLTALAPGLRDWFRATLPAAGDLVFDNLEMPQDSGVANETLMCNASWTSAGEKHSERFVVRISNTNFLYKDVDFASHRLMYEALRDVQGVPVPEIVGHEDAGEVLGRPFFVMKRIEGRVPADTPPFHVESWVKNELTQEQRHQMWTDAVAVMARLHQVDPSRFEFLQRPALGASGLEQDLRAWLDYMPWAMAGRSNTVIETAAQWLLDNLPERRPTELAWGDSRVGNMMFRDHRVVAVFDWDMVSLAGAESDLAWWTIMDYLNTVAMGVPRLSGIGSPAETIRLWQELTGREVPDLWYQLVYAAYRMSVILVRISDLLEGAVPHEYTIELRFNNSGMQYLATMLDIEPVGPVTVPWPGLEL